MKAPHRLGVWVIAASCALAFGASGESQRPLLDFYASEAQASDPAFSGFSAQRGEQLFRTHFTIGKPDTPSCTTCHTTDPKKVGQTRAGKEIDPMAASVSPKRYTDREKAEKWFGRNCKNVLGRECTPTEKGDFITFMLTQ
jgi:mono/diheme cytochrome c family protein